MLLLASRWHEVENHLSELIQTLSEKESLTQNQLYRLREYQKFLVELRQEINQFSLEAEKLILNHKRQIASLEIIPGALSKRQAGLFIGLSQEGTPLFKLLQESYPETAVKLTNTLLKGISLGYSPEKTARMMIEDMSGNLSRALRIARTEQMFIFRETTRLQMEQAGMSEWEWLAEEDACEFCQSQSGKRFPVSQSMDTHPNCRCAMLPMVNK